MRVAAIRGRNGNVVFSLDGKTALITGAGSGIGRQIAPGVPALAAGPLRLALKSGNFGGPDFFARALAVLGAA